MPRTVQIVYAQSTEAALQDSALLVAGLKHVAAAPGALGVYCGVAEENPTVLYVFVVWDTVEHPTTFMNDQGTFKKLEEAFAPCVSEGTTQTNLYVNFEPDTETAAALNAPVTSFTHMPSYTPKGANGALFAEMKKRNKGVTESPGCCGGAYGQLLERDEYAVLYGWESVEAHAKVMSDMEGVGLGEIVTMAAEMNRVHVKLTTVAKYEV